MPSTQETVLRGLLLVQTIYAAVAAAPFCTRGATCWPTASEVAALKAQLDPAASRVMYWNGNESVPKPDPLVYYPAINEPPQVLGGAGVSGLQPLYEQPQAELNRTCFENSLTSDFCGVTARSNPQEGWSPAFVVFPLNTTHVQAAVQFAAKHNLKICVAATGHDFLNRHSCDQGLMIRTGLLKSSVWNLDSTNKFNSSKGYVTFGTGVTWEEVSAAAAANNRLIASGWCGTVGIAGWHLGGGYGPFTRKFGLGADNVLEVEMVLADGTLAVANAAGTTLTYPNGTTSTSTNLELFWAVRGGGGSTFGILTSMTVRAHALSTGGVTGIVMKAESDLCSGKAVFQNFTSTMLDWMAQLGPNWAGITGMSQTFNASAACNLTASFQLQYAYYGSYNDTEFAAQIGAIATAGAQVLPGGLLDFTDQYSFLGLVTAVNPGFVYIEAVPGALTPTATFNGSFPSVLVPKAVATDGQLASFVQTVVDGCQAGGACPALSFSQGMPAAAATDSATAVSPGMRQAAVHVWSTTPGLPSQYMDGLYALGNYSYFGESAYNMPEWPFRYWGLNNYKRLLTVKAAVDPTGVLTCHHCVGDKYSGSDAYGLEYFNDLQLWAANTSAPSPPPASTPNLPPASLPPASSPPPPANAGASSKRLDGIGFAVIALCAAMYLSLEWLY